MNILKIHVQFAGAKVVIRKSKAGKKYFICENNTGVGKGCDYISWNEPKIGEKWDPSSVKTVDTKSGTKKKSSKKTTKRKVVKKK